MKDQGAFNPALPAEFKMLTEKVATIEPEQQPTGSNTPINGARKGKRKTQRSEKRSDGAAGSPKKKKSKLNWQRLKGKVHGKLAGLDREKLKHVLTACGIAAGVVLAIVLAIKMVPIAALLLALLGLAGVVRVWDRLRGLPRPVW